MNFTNSKATIFGLFFLTIMGFGCKNDGKQNQEAGEVTAADSLKNPNGGDSTIEQIANQPPILDTASLGKLVKKKLSCGAELHVPENGFEAKLTAFIEDKTSVVDKDSWFAFDHLTFQTGSSKLDMEKSVEQLTNLSRILKCYPSLKVKIGSYTDNVGTPESNLKLSADRATTIKATLIGFGAAPTSMSSEGFGDKNPVAPNDTAEGRALNHRSGLWVLVK